MIQEFKLIREPSVKGINGGEGYTRGKLYRDGRFLCETLEDEDRFLENGVTEKVYGRTAIPRGRYRLQNTMSKKFGKVLPLLLDVPGYAGVRIHGGNSAANTLGCILVGRVRTQYGIAQCADMVQTIIKMIQEASANKVETYLEIA